MKDQVWEMEEKGVQAAYVGDAEDQETIADVCGGKYQIVYISPESLLTDDTWRDMLESPMYQESLVHVGLILDEAHCVKKWGETFRTEFANLGEVRSLIPDNVRLMALPATATKTTRNDVCRKLGMIEPVAITQFPNRPNSLLGQILAQSKKSLAPLVEELKRCRVNMDILQLRWKPPDRHCNHCVWNGVRLPQRKKGDALGVVV